MFFKQNTNLRCQHCFFSFILFFLFKNWFIIFVMFCYYCMINARFGHCRHQSGNVIWVWTLYGVVMVLRGINYFMSCKLNDDIWQQNAALLGGDNVTVLKKGWLLLCQICHAVTGMWAFYAYQAGLAFTAGSLCKGAWVIHICCTT